MINDEPSTKEMAALWALCMEFVEQQRISCPEAIYQTDRVIENAYDFVADVCERVGYFKEEDEE